MRTEIRGGRVIDPASGRDEFASVFIADGRVQAIAAELGGFSAERVVEARGAIVCPGFIELGAHIGEPGAEQRGNVASESRAAVAGGFTTLCMLPGTEPVVDSPAVVELIRGRAEAVGLARIEILGALTAGLDGERLAEMFTLKSAGCLAVTNAYAPVTSTEVMRRALDYAATFDLTVMLHAEDPWLSAGRQVHGGLGSFMQGLDAIPETAETVVVARDLLLVEQTGSRAHFCRLSSARAVRMVAEARAGGLPVSADVGLPYLFLTDADVEGFDARCHVRPPLRSSADRDALRRALADGSVQAACADHQPQHRDAKLNPFPMTAPGISGLDTALGLLLCWAQTCAVALPRALATLTCAPAAIVGLDRGRLQPGAVADLCIFDPHHPRRVDTASFVSRGRNSPFDGSELPGRVLATLVAGRVVYEAA